jgi:hypothetical protein
MDRRLDWIMWKGAFAAALYFAVVAQLPWAQYALIAFVWWMLASTVTALLPGSASRRIVPPAAPQWTAAAIPQVSAMAFDLGVLASMFLAHWYWTACAYAAYCGCLVLVQVRSTSKP